MIRACFLKPWVTARTTEGVRENEEEQVISLLEILVCSIVQRDCECKRVVGGEQARWRRGRECELD